MDAEKQATGPELGAEAPEAPRPKKKGGRPRKIVDPDEIEALASRGLNKKQVGMSVGLSESGWFNSKSREAWDASFERGRAAGVLKMRSVIFDSATKGEWKAAESWLKSVGEYENKMKIEQTGRDGGPIEVVDARKALYEKLAKLLPDDDVGAASQDG